MGATIGVVAKVVGALGAVKQLTTKAPKPDVAQQSPVADASAAETAAAQEAATRKLQQRRAARANSLLSAAGAAGDPSDPLNAVGVAVGKTSLGA